MSEVNQQAYDIMLGTTFDVVLERDGEEFKLQCRPLPFTTLMHVLGEVVISAQVQIVQARRTLMEDFVNQGIDNPEPNQVIDIIMPIVSSIAVETPELVTRFLQDVVIGFKPEHQLYFQLEDVLEIVEQVLMRVDTQRVADKIKKVFSRATEISQTAMADQIKKDKASKDRRPKKSKSPSPSKQPVSI